METLNRIINDNHTEKPTVVIVSNGITPYGVHFLERVAHEFKDYKLRTIYSYEFSMGQWPIELPVSINSVILGEGEVAVGQKGVKSLWKGWARSQELIREIKAANPVAVMILGYGYFSHYLVIEWCKRVGIPCLMWGDSNIRGDRHKGLRAWIKKKVLTRVVSRCSALLPCGSLGLQYFQKYGASSEQIFLVPNEPDYSLIEGVDCNVIAQVSKEFRLQSQKQYLIYSGRLVPVKRIDLLIDAFVQIADQRPTWDLIIAGGGALESELKDKIPEHIQGRLVWTGFISTPEKMAALYKLSDVLVLPSDYEPWALVVNEATCAGLAIVCSNVVGAAAELLLDGKNGRFFKTSDVSSLRDAILDVTKHENTGKYKASSPQILQGWRQKADPVDGFRRALDFSLSRVET